MRDKGFYYFHCLTLGTAIHEISKRRTQLILSEMHRIKTLPHDQLAREFSDHLCTWCKGAGTYLESFCPCVNRRLPFGFKVKT